MAEENKRPEDLVAHVTGIIKAATDAGFTDPLSEVLQQIAETSVADFAVHDNEDLTIEIPLVFYARAKTGGGDGHLKLASVGGEHAVMEEAERDCFTKNRLFMQKLKAENKATYLEGEVQRLEDALETTDFYGRDE